MQSFPSLPNLLGALLLVAASATGSAMPPDGDPDPEPFSSPLAPGLLLQLQVLRTDSLLLLVVAIPMGVEPAATDPVWLLPSHGGAGAPGPELMQAIRPVHWEPHLRHLVFTPPPHAPGEVSFQVRMADGSWANVPYTYPETPVADGADGVDGAADDPTMPLSPAAAPAPPVPASAKAGTKRPLDPENQAPNLPLPDAASAATPSGRGAKQPRIQDRDEVPQEQAVAALIPPVPPSLRPPLHPQPRFPAQLPGNHPDSPWPIFQMTFAQRIGRTPATFHTTYRSAFQTAMARNDVDQAIDILNSMEGTQTGGSISLGTPSEPAAASSSSAAGAAPEARCIPPLSLRSIEALHDHQLSTLAILDAREDLLRQLAADLAKRSADLDRRQAELDRRQAELDRLGPDLGFLREDF